MFKTDKNTLLSTIIKLSEKLQNSQLKDEVIESVKPQLSKLSEYLGVDEECALFFTIIFVLQNQNSNPVNLHDIAGFLDYSFLHILEFRYCLSVLEDNYLIFIDERAAEQSQTENNGYKIIPSVMNCIIGGKELSDIDENGGEKTSYNIIDEFIDLESEFNRGRFNVDEYTREITKLEKKYRKNLIINNLQELFPEDMCSRLIMYYLIGTNVFEISGAFNFTNGENRPDDFLQVLPKQYISKRRNMFKDETDILMKEEFLCIKFKDIEDLSGRTTVPVYSLTKKAIVTVLGEESKDYVSSVEESETELELTLQAIYEIGYYYESKTSNYRKESRISRVEERCRDFKFFKKVIQIEKKKENRFIFYDCMYDFIRGYSSTVTVTLQDYYSHSQKYFSNLREMLDESHPLVVKNLLEINKVDVVERCSMDVTEKAIELLYGKNADIFSKNKRSSNIRQPQDLKQKELFYSDTVQKQIDVLTESLNQKNLNAMQKRLSSKGLAKGIAIILYGAPGTGKTETVYQLAKKTNRQIFHVDIADSKSMWFGESEKLIKKIFTEYRILCKNCKSHHQNTPILLFNEADALISKRKDVSSGSCANTENAIQNILLEEMEKMEGIMIATTNLCENMDKAFERRFLFKIKYEKPSMEIRKSIWKSKISFLDEQEIGKIASAYDFSGGEIDNVVRKCEIEEVINGKIPDMDRLIEICKEERLEKEENKKVGFIR